MADGLVEPGAGIPVRIRFHDGRTTMGTIDVRMIGPGRRLMLGLRALAICWMFAALAIMVPLLHWVLVPGIALLGPVFAMRALSRDRQVCGGGGPCPVCGSALAFSGSTRPEDFSHGCRFCRASLQVVPESAPPA